MYVAWRPPKDEVSCYITKTLPSVVEENEEQFQQYDVLRNRIILVFWYQKFGISPVNDPKQISAQWGLVQN